MHDRHGPDRPGSGRRTADPAATTAEVTAWFAGRLPDGWFTSPAEVVVDRDEITVVGPLPAPELPAGAGAAETAQAEAGRITRFREDTRDARIGIAQEAERRYGRKVAWGAVSGSTRQVFTTISVPVMTRLRQPERQVLDTLVDAGVARSRSDALAWAVRLVGRNQEEWIRQLRDALVNVERARAAGPEA